MGLPQSLYCLPHALLAHTHHFHSPFIVHVLDFPTCSSNVWIRSGAGTELACARADEGTVGVEGLGSLGMIVDPGAGLFEVYWERRELVCYMQSQEMKG